MVKENIGKDLVNPPMYQ